MDLTDTPPPVYDNLLSIQVTKEKKHPDLENPQGTPKPTSGEVPVTEHPNALRRRRIAICCVFGAIALLFVLGASLVIGFATSGYRSDTCSLTASYTRGDMQTFSGQSIKTVYLVNNGDLVVTPSPELPCLTAFSVITAETVEAAMAFPYRLHKDLNGYSLVYPYTPHQCPRQDVEAVMLDWDQSGPIALSGSTSSGSIKFSGAFHHLPFHSLDLQTLSGNINITTQSAQSSLFLSTSTGEVTVGTFHAPQISVQTSSGSVVMGKLRAANTNIAVAAGDLSIDSLVISQPTSCSVYLRTSSGSITLPSLMFPATGSCAVNIISETGDINVAITNDFAGSVYLTSSTGRATLNGVACPMNICRSTWLQDEETQAAQHSISITANTGDVTLSISTADA